MLKTVSDDAEFGSFRNLQEFLRPREIECDLERLRLENKKTPCGKVNKDMERCLIPQFERRKQVSIESEKILFILSSAVTHAQWLSWIPNVIVKLHNVKRTVSDDYVTGLKCRLSDSLVILLKALRDAVVEYEDIKNKPAASNSYEVIRNYSDLLISKSKQDEDSDLNTSFNELDKMRVILEFVLQHLKDNQQDVEKLYTEQSKDASKHLKGIAMNLRKLEEFTYHAALMTNVEKHERSNWLYDLWLATKEHEDDIDRLHEEIRNVKEDFESETANRKKLVESASAAEKFEMEKDAIESVQRQYEDIYKAHLKSEAKYRDSKYKVETEAYGCIDKYDQDMRDRDEAILDITEDIEKQDREIDALQSKVYYLKPDYDEIVSDRYLEEQKRRWEQEEAEKRERAALLIQAYWRRWHTLKVRRDEAKAMQEAEDEAAGKPKKDQGGKEKGKGKGKGSKKGKGKRSKKGKGKKGKKAKPVQVEKVGEEGDEEETEEGTGDTKKGKGKKGKKGMENMMNEEDSQEEEEDEADENSGDLYDA